MIGRQRVGAALGVMAMMLSACGGGSSGGGTVITPTPTPTPTVTPTPTPTPIAGCSLRERQDWAFAQMNEWYLFPETLPASLNPSPYPNVGSYIDALTATARAQRRDRYFTYLTSIAEENAYYNSGASAGFGFRLGANSAARRIFIIESFEGAPALAAGIDRGAEILAIGPTTNTLRNVSDIIAAEGTAGVTDALGPDISGTTRILRIADAGGTRNVTLAKADFELLPVSTRYGGKVIDNGGTKVGYVNLRTFINTADPALRQVFADFRAQGVTQFIIDLRYNGGGLVSIAELMGDLMGGGRAATDAFDYMTFRPDKAAENEVHYFTQQPQTVSPVKVAFIGTGGTASASEMLINGFLPYLHTNMALIGTNTYGKPVGQIALDKPECDDRLRVIAFAVENAQHQGAYFNGLANTVEASCQASDDIGHPLGDPLESSTAAALNFLAGRACTRISSASAAARTLQLGTPEERQLLAPKRPSTMQREVPGAF
jgi:C-terminal processing protease CtpA/Prc